MGYPYHPYYIILHIFSIYLDLLREPKKKEKQKFPLGSPNGGCPIGKIQKITLNNPGCIYIYILISLLILSVLLLLLLSSSLLSLLLLSIFLLSLSLLHLNISVILHIYTYSHILHSSKLSKLSKFHPIVPISPRHDLSQHLIRLFLRRHAGGGTCMPCG